MNNISNTVLYTFSPNKKKNAKFLVLRHRSDASTKPVLHTSNSQHSLAPGSPFYSNLYQFSTEYLTQHTSASLYKMLSVKLVDVLAMSFSWYCESLILMTAATKKQWGTLTLKKNDFSCLEISSSSALLGKDCTSSTLGSKSRTNGLLMGNW